MEGLDFNSMLGESEIENLFMDTEETSATEETEEEKGKQDNTNDPSEHDETDETTEVVDPEGLFEDEEEVEKQPESVGSEEKSEGKEGSSTDDGGGTSPQNFYSSIANAMAEDGIFPNLDEETIKKADDPETFSNLIEAEVQARLDEKQQRISRALENGVEPTDIKRYEGVLQQIASITDQQIMEESEKGEQLRKNLIYQDYINKGIAPAKAQKMTERSVDAGTDVEDAKEALQSNREFFQKQYNDLLENAQREAEQNQAERKKQAEALKNSIMKDKNLLGDMELSQDVRKRVFEDITKPVYKDPETGEYMTALQKYEVEHRADFLKYVGLFYRLTNGFKDFDSFVKGKVRKETKKGLAALEQTLNSTRRDSNGNLRMVTNAKDDPESFIGQGFKLDI